MGISQKAVLALLVGCFMSAGAQAAVSYGDGQPYVGAKIGQFMVDDDRDNFDDTTAFGVYAGYNFTPGFGMEAEYVGSSEKSFSISSGFSGLTSNIDYDFKKYGIYGTYRYMFPNTAIYAKGKIGFAKVEIEIDTMSGYLNEPNHNRRIISESISDSGLTGGIGIGYLVNPNIAIEAEYALVAEDLDYALVAEDLDLLTIGVNLKF